MKRMNKDQLSEKNGGLAPSKGKERYRLFDNINDDASSLQFKHASSYCIMMAISFFMSLVNFIEGRAIFAAVLFVFALLCGGNLLLSRQGKKRLYLSGVIFSVEVIVLLTIFIVTGIPGGFSVIWVCLLPTSGFLLFQRKWGTILCGVMFLIILFLFATPWGDKILWYPYSDTLKYHFLLLYAAFFGISYFLETVRAVTYEDLVSSRKRYAYLYTHDALTGVLNRYGFNEYMDRLLFLSGKRESVTLLLLNIDDFQGINAIYGYLNGDKVLKSVAELLVTESGENAAVCRWGGESFGVLKSPGDDGKELADRLLAAVEALTWDTEEGNLHLSASIGVVVATANARRDPAFLVQQADKCLYQARITGHDKVVFQRLWVPQNSAF